MIRIVSDSLIKKDVFSERIDNTYENQKVEWGGKKMKDYTQEEIDKLAISIINMSKEQLRFAFESHHPGTYWYRHDLVTTGGIPLQNLFLLCLAAKDLI